MQLTDQIGRSVILPKKPKRIISLVPSITELLYYLELEANVVGITRFCTHPPHWRKTKTVVGGTKDVSLETVQSLNPDLIIANKEENIKEQIDFLSDYSPVYTSDVIKLLDALQMVRDIGILCGQRTTAQDLENKLKYEFQNVSKISKSCIYLIWQEPIMVAGANTFIDSLLKKMGLSNLVSKVREERYPTITETEIRRLNPDIILLSSEPYPFKSRNKKDFSDRFPEALVELIDGRIMSWYGSALLEFPSYSKVLSAQLKGG